MAKYTVTSLVVTIGFQMIVNGTLLSATRGRVLLLQEVFPNAYGISFGVVLLGVFAASLVFIYLFLNRSYLGKHCIAIGENRDMVQNSGVNVTRQKVCIHALQTFCGPEPCILREGDYLLFNSKAIHGFKRAGAENLCLFIQFPPVLFGKMPDSRQLYYFYLNSTNHQLAPTVPYAYFAELAARIGLLIESNEPSAKLRISALLHTLAADFVEFVQYDMRSYPLGQGQEDAGDITEKLSKYVDSNLQSQTITADICKQLGMSEKTLYRYLKNTLGLTMKELIDTARIERSRQFLRESDKPISIIAYECGFSGEVTYYRSFKKEMGLTPMEYRRGGDSKPVGPQVQGYLSFNESEAQYLLRRYAGDIR